MKQAADDLDLEKGLCEHIPLECMLCLEELDEALESLQGCAHCGKQWCTTCDLRWRITQTSASLLPTCPFCRKRLHALSTEQSDEAARQRRILTEQQLFDKLLISLLKWISYLMLALVLILLPFVEAYLTNENEAFVAYFFLILLVFLFLACHYRRAGRRTVDEEDSDDGSQLTV